MEVLAFVVIREAEGGGVKKCLNCYREVEDNRQVICPDCGYVLHSSDEMSSEDADDGVFAPDRDMIALIDDLENKFNEYKAVKSDMVCVSRAALLSLITNSLALVKKIRGNDANNSPKA